MASHTYLEVVTSLAGYLLVGVAPLPTDRVRYSSPSPLHNTRYTCCGPPPRTTLLTLTTLALLSLSTIQGERERQSL